MKAAKAILIPVLILALAGALLCGCQKGTESQTAAVQTVDDSSELVKVVSNESVFQQTDAGGMEIWFDRWYMNGGKSDFVQDYIIGGKTLKTGLGIDGLTDNGYDTRNFAFVKFKVLKGRYSELSGVFGFDDNTPVRSDSRLIIFAGEQKLYESPILNGSLGSTEVRTALPAATSEFTIRFETNASDGKLPKLIFGDIAAKKVK